MSWRRRIDLPDWLTAFTATELLYRPARNAAFERCPASKPGASVAKRMRHKVRALTLSALALTLDRSQRRAGGRGRSVARLPPLGGVESNRLNDHAASGSRRRCDDERPRLKRAMRLPKLSSIRPISVAAFSCGVALASVAPLAATASSAAPARAAATPRCATSGLVIWLNTSGSGAAGSIYYNLYLTNLSGRSCTLRGYPGVSAVNLGGRQLGAGASRETGQKPSVVTLARGATAMTVLRVVQAGNFPASACREVTAAGLRVFPPGQTASKVVPFPFQACSRAGQSVLAVRAVALKP